ncbi:hypothetical protein [Phreatobacter sp.]|uniref:hypothetical protein n=1 Tax=Phreatobacter sp. TaxID=1966341 RepID=UPI003F7246EF
MEQPVLLVAAALTLAVGLLHSWLGERMLIAPLLALPARDGPLARASLRRVLRNAWHITSVAWAGMGLVLASLAFAPLESSGRKMLVIIGLMFAGQALFVLATSRGRHVGWPFFAAIGAISLWAAA